MMPVTHKTRIEYNEGTFRNTNESPEHKKKKWLTKWKKKLIEGLVDKVKKTPRILSTEGSIRASTSMF